MLLGFTIVRIQICVEGTDIDTERYVFWDNFSEIDSQPHYAVNPETAENLALLEEQLVKAITEKILQGTESTFHQEAKDNCHYRLKKYLTRYEKDAQSLHGLTGVLKAKTVAENPLFTFKMIRRIYVTLINESLSLCQEDRIDEMVKNLFDKMNLKPPTDRDYQDSLLGILRIHFVYGFKAEDIQRGLFKDIQTNATLDLEDCLALADKAVATKLDVLAYQWMQAAISVSSSEFLSLENAWAELMKLANVDTLEELHEKLGNKVQNTFGDANHSLWYDYDFYAPCREEMETNKREDDYKHVCLLAGFHWDPYFTISPVKVEVLSRDPLILQCYDFVGESEIQYIKRITGGSLKRSLVDGYNGEYLCSPERSSISTYLESKDEKDSIMIRLNKRIERLTDLEVIKENASELQVVKYGSLGGHYDFHLDEIIDPDHSTFTYGIGNRIATFLMFLSNVTMGGYTVFPDLQIHVKPIKGSAILWYSFTPNCQPDYWTLHGGCPIVLGHKIVANQWILEYANMWKYPCVNLN